MNNRFSELFIRRPVATTLLTIGIAFAGLLAFGRLPVSPLPQVDFATISVPANMPGASPDNMASAVAAPLEKHLGQIADVTEMTSRSSPGYTRITLQFGLNRNIDGAARDVEAAINAARADLPTSLRQNPTYHKVNPADFPIMVLSLTSRTRPPGELYDVASNVLQQRLSQLDGVGEVDVSGSALPGVRVELNPAAMFKYGLGLEDVRAALASANANSPKGAIEDDDFHYQIYANDQASKASQYRDLVVAYRNNSAIRLRDIAEVVDSVEDLRNAGFADGMPAVALTVWRQARRGHHRRRRRREGGAAATRGLVARRRRSDRGRRSFDNNPRIAAGHGDDADCVGRSGDPRGVRLSARYSSVRHYERGCAGFDPGLVRGDVSARIQRQQSLVDGAHDIQRLRRRRCDRRASRISSGTSNRVGPRFGGNLGASEVGSPSSRSVCR